VPEVISELRVARARLDVGRGIAAHSTATVCITEVIGGRLEWTRGRLTLICVTHEIQQVFGNKYIILSYEETQIYILIFTNLFGYIY